jgi:hypothetical protein
VSRYIARPAVSEKRLSLTPYGNVRYQLKTPYRESLPRERSECFGYGTTHVIFEPLDFIARLAALVPKPRVNLARYHAVFASNSRHRRLCLADIFKSFIPSGWRYRKRTARDMAGLMPGITTHQGLAKAMGERASAEQVFQVVAGTGRCVTRA